MGKLTKDRRDIYYRRAKEQGYRARSAYKLLHLNDQFQLFKGVRRVVDLCAAPGSWSQVARNELWKAHEGLREEKRAIHVSKPKGDSEKWKREIVCKEATPLVSGMSSAPDLPNADLAAQPLIVSVDLQEMAPIEGVTLIQGDITDVTTLCAISEYFGGELADLILCDGAPDVTGMHDIDEYIQAQLLLSALNVCAQILVKGGTFVAKVFRGENICFLYTQLQVLFQNVYCCKPASSRNSSLEAFVVCKNFELPLPLPQFLRSEFYKHMHYCGYQHSTQCEVDSETELQHKDSTNGDTLANVSTLPAYRLTSDSLQQHYVNCVVPFIACGDLEGFDADRNYTIENLEDSLHPIQYPIHAPYEEALLAKRGWRADK